MPNTVGGHQQSPFTTPVDGAPNSAADVLNNDEALRGKFNDHDADAGIHIQSSATGARPAAGTSGRLWYTTDDNRLWADTGVAWVSAGYALAAHTHSAADVTSGTLADARLSANVPLKSAANVFAAAQAMQAGLLVGETSSQAGGIFEALSTAGFPERGFVLGNSNWSPSTSTGSCVFLGHAAGTGNAATTVQAFQAGTSAVATLSLNPSGGAIALGGVPEFAGGTSVAATAGAATLPAAPVAFLNVTVGGVARRIPLYAV